MFEAGFGHDVTMTGDGSSNPVGRQLPVQYRFRGARAELKETFPETLDELPVLEGVVSVRRLGIGAGPGLVILTERRLCLLVHYFFRNDRAFEFPRGSLTNIEPIRILATIHFWRFTYRVADGTAVIDLADASFRPPATVAMGPTIKLTALIRSLTSTWGNDAPRT